MMSGKDRNLQIPFGPFLAAAGWIALIWGDKIMSNYSSAFSVL
jgi:leader peptidase (prepilin peptidase)/N-methyltransferase